MGKLAELAERCEAATGPDRELDEAIDRAALPQEWANEFFDPSRHDLPSYTASIDAAMTLAPVTLQVGVLLDAIDACQSDEDRWLADLPRYVAAAALRARHSTPDERNGALSDADS